jgi:hypothetical protein
MQKSSVQITLHDAADGSSAGFLVSGWPVMISKKNIRRNVIEIIRNQEWVLQWKGD